MRILGVSCDYHDAAAALVVDGEVIAAVEQERLSRVKHDSSLPSEAIESCLEIGGVDAGRLDAVVFHEKPLVVASRVLAARQRRGPMAVGAFAREFPVLLRRNLLVSYRLEKVLRSLGADDPPRLVFGEHHLSHASAAFYPSPFDTAAILTVDGVGEWSTATIAQGIHHRVDLLAEQRYPHSLGLLYSLATSWCGFEPNEGEYKLMGLAPFGSPNYVDQLSEIIDIHDDGSFEIDGRAVKWWGAEPNRLRKLVKLFDGPPLPRGDAVTQREADLAHSVQILTERVIVRMAEHAQERTGERNLCLAGGVALNCVANGRLLREGPFDQIWVQPAAGDSGSALGAALWFWHQESGNQRRPPASGSGAVGISDAMSAGALGPRVSCDEVRAWIDELGLDAEHVPDESTRCRRVAERLATGAVVGWFEGRMEFGPRALGHRSILADPRSSTVQRDLNLRVKGRESFRPFAPAVLWERASDWFDLDRPSPYMLFTFQVAAEHLAEVGAEPEDFFERVQVPRSDIPACTHVDGSARVQTVHEETAPVFHHLLREFEAITGCPVLLNTSFNRAGDPIVCTPDHALQAARAAGLDLLVIEEFLIDPSARHEDPDAGGRP